MVLAREFDCFLFFFLEKRKYFVVTTVEIVFLKNREYWEAGGWDFFRGTRRKLRAISSRGVQIFSFNFFRGVAFNLSCFLILEMLQNFHLSRLRDCSSLCFYVVERKKGKKYLP